MSANNTASNIITEANTAPANTTSSKTPQLNIEPVVLTLKQTAQYLCMNYTTLWRLRDSDPSFPKAIRLGKAKLVYRRAQLDEYLANRPSVELRKKD